MDAMSDYSGSSEEKFVSDSNAGTGELGHFLSNGECCRKTDLQLCMAIPTSDECSLSATLKYFCWPFDMRFEDLHEAGTPQFYRVLFRDSMAGLVSAMLAIPLAMAFAMASGLQPGQGIVAGAMAGLLGALFGGSKYQVNGPTATFIPVINAIMALYIKGGPLYASGSDEEEMFRRGHGLLVFISLLAALIFMALGVARVGTLASKVPYCIVVGFTIGIAVTIAFALSEEAMGVEKANMYPGTNLGIGAKLMHLYKHVGNANGYAIVMAIGTMLFMQISVQISVLIPAGFLAIALSTILAETVWSGKHLSNVFDSYGTIPSVVSFTPPLLYHGDGSIIHMLGIILYFAITIVVLGAVESLLCARMADRLAGNKGTPFHPNKELWGQGWVNLIVPMLDGFPHAGSLAKTAMHVKLGAATPLAAIMTCFVKVTTLFTCARCLELIPMASIAGLLWYVAVNMISVSEMKRVRRQGGWAHVFIMCLTAIIVIATDFLRGVACGMIIYALGFFAAPYLPEWMVASRGHKGYDSARAPQEEKVPILKHSDGSIRGRSCAA